MKFRSKDKESVRIDITSLVDVVFLLLIFFMVSTTFLDRPGLRLALPDTQSATPSKVEKMVITVTRDNRIFVGIEELDVDILSEKVKEYVSQTEDKNVRIRGDQQVNFGTIIKVMDICRINGATGVTIETEKKK
ncbi:MAG: biopolymer transporter ExbD [Acidobacteria bacterium]|nr:biopolymer transporter ExbD [Acidobacteriota bacterium]